MADSLQQSLLNKARQDKFLLSLSTPEALKASKKTKRSTGERSHLAVIPDSMQYSVFGTLVPGVNIPAIEAAHSGQTLKVSSHTRSAYTDVTVNFTIDNQFSNYWFIWRWLDILNDAKRSQYDAHLSDANIPGSVPDSPNLLLDYQTNFTIYGLNEYNKNTVEFTYTNAFPVSLGEITYNYRQPSEIESSFSFSFTQLLVKLL